MIDLATGRFVLREGVELYPGMKREDFFKSELYQNELWDERDKDDETTPYYFIKPQMIDGFEVNLMIWISRYGYIRKIEITKPEFHEWPNWPKDKSEEEYAYEIQAYHIAFLKKQIEGCIEEGEDPSFYYTWGSIDTTLSLMHHPDVKLIIEYRQAPILKALGKVYSFNDISELF